MIEYQVREVGRVGKAMKTKRSGQNIRGERLEGKDLTGKSLKGKRSISNLLWALKAPGKPDSGFDVLQDGSGIALQSVGVGSPYAAAAGEAYVADVGGI